MMKSDSTTTSSSSSSSETSSSNSSQESTSSSSTSSVSTQALPSKKSSKDNSLNRNFQTHNRDSSKQMQSSDSYQADDTDTNRTAGLMASVSHVRRYMNSPFGLTQHYLTMPEPPSSPSGAVNQIEQLAGQLTDTTRKKSLAPADHLDDSDESDGLSSSNELTRQHNKLPPLQIQPTSAHHREPASNDMSVLADDSSSPVWVGSQARWLNYKRQKGTLASSQESKKYRRHNSHLTRPAGDAGLDASRCNAKDAAGRKDILECACIEGEVGGGSRPKMLVDRHTNWSQPVKVPEPIAVGPTGCESSGLLVRFSSIMYATFLVILGCILHVSELRQKSKNSSDHIYTIIVALIGIAWLLFLQTDLQRYKRYASKYILIESIFNDHRQLRREADRLARRQSTDPSARSITSSSASLVNDRMSMNTEVIFKKTAYTMYQHRAELERANNVARGQFSPVQNYTSKGLKSPLPKPYDAKSSSSISSMAPDNHSSTPLTTWSEFTDKENLVPAYKFLHGKMGANFYLKCGMAAFCFGHVIHEGLRFGQQVYFFGTGNVHCRDSAAMIAHLVTPLYSFYQLFMMFKYSNLVINRHKIMARFGLMHIIGTSVTFWFRTILEEAFEDFVHKMDYFKTQNKPMRDLLPGKPSEKDSSLMSLISSISNAIKIEASERSELSLSNSSTIEQNLTKAQSLFTLMSSPISATITPQMVRHLPESYACAQNTLLTTKSMNALPYLYPFTIEYNLLLAATFLSLYFNIGKLGGIGKHASHDNCMPVTAIAHDSPFLNSKGIIDNMSTKTSSSEHQLTTNSRGDSPHSRDGEKELGGGEYKSNFVVNADCHSANKGLFCGFFVLLVTLVTIVIFFVTINKPSHIQLGIKINLIQEATLTALILIVTLAGFKQVVKLNRNPYLKEKVTTDDVLMLIPLPFFFIHSLLSFRAETATMSAGSIPTLSTVVLQRGHHHHQNDPLTTSTGNLQSILVSASSNNNGNNSNNNDSSGGGGNRIGAGRIGASSDISNQRANRIQSNIMLPSHPNGTSGRFVDQFISINNNINVNDNRNSRNISSSSEATSNINSSHIDHFKLITVGLNIIVMIEVLVQTNFIIDGMRRCSESRYLRFKKPGRELITFAILLNITYWIVATFETKSVEQYKTEIEYYGPLPYMFISHTTLPVMLFYRYHSSVCLAEIWNRAYKPPKRR